MIEIQDPMIELVPGSNMMIGQAKLAKLELISKDGTVLARNLFRYFFSVEELGQHSLYGISCNANKTVPPAPEIDGAKRNAIFGNLIFDMYLYL